MFLFVRFAGTITTLSVLYRIWSSHLLEKQPKRPLDKAAKKEKIRESYK